MEKKKINFTNETLAKKFKSNFELVNYAIQLADNMIKTGRDARVKSDMQNRAMLILEEINEGKDQFDEIKEVAPRQSDQAKSELQQQMIYEEKAERRRYKAAAYAHEE